MPRREFPKAVREAALARAAGQCEASLPDGTRCPCALVPAHYRFDHVIPDANGGEPSLANCQVICCDCDAAKYRTDRPAIDRTRRLRERHEGTKAPSRRPVPGSKASGLSRGLDGLTRDRATGRILSRPSVIDVRSL